MIKKISIILIALVIGMVCIAGCTTDTGGATPTVTPTPLPAETGVSPTQAAPDLMPQPTDVVPTTLFVEIATSKDPITGDITVTFRGGKGQNQVNEITAVVISGTGATTTKIIEPNVNAEAVFTVDDGEATKGEDRIMVTVSFYDGSSYKIYDDVLSRTRTTN